MQQHSRLRAATRALCATLALALFCVGSARAHAPAPEAALPSPAPQSSTNVPVRPMPKIPQMPQMGPLGTSASKTSPASVSPIFGPMPSTAAGPGISVQLNTGDDTGQKLSTGVEIALLITLLTLAPAIILSLTSFTRIVIVLSFMKRAMSVQELPPSLIVTGFAFFLTLFIMKPTLDKLYSDAWLPYSEDRISIVEAGAIAESTMSEFLSKQTRPTDLELMYDIAQREYPSSYEEVPFHLLVPAFVLSEIKTAFQMGFVLFLPFLVIDLVISSVLISMGMFTLPPIVISTPFKVLLFILVDGWNLVIKSAVQSYYL